MIGIGSVCSGYGGLDMAVVEVFGGEVSWFFEYEAAPSKVLAFHWPHVPNYGDLTRAPWHLLKRATVLCGGTPCQDLSGAGKRAGMSEGTRSNLWVHLREGIAIQRPDYVVWENVRGAYSVGADSEVEREPGLLGVTPRGSLRALGRVLGDLSSLGYDAEVVPLRASDVGAPHQRFRVFVIARRQDLADTNGQGFRGVGRVEPEPCDAHGRSRTDGTRDTGEPSTLPSVAGVAGSVIDGDSGSALEDAYLAARSEWGQSAPGQAESGRSRADAGRRGRAPVTDDDFAADTGGIRGERRGATPDMAGTPAEDEGGKRGEQWDAVDDRRATDWGPYGPAIRRWERVLGRVAPAPTELSESYVRMLRARLERGHKKPVGMRGSLVPRIALSLRFVEWMMGAPEGHVTAPEIGLTRTEELTALGNGVVTLQAVAAIRIGLARLDQPVETRWAA